MIDPTDRHLSIVRQSDLLGVSRSRYSYRPRSEPVADIEEKIRLKELFLQVPFYGYRTMALELEYLGYHTTPKRVRRLMREPGLSALTPRQLTSQPTKEHPTYPYLLRNTSGSAIPTRYGLPISPP